MCLAANSVDRTNETERSKKKRELFSVFFLRKRIAKSKPNSQFSSKGLAFPAENSIFFGCIFYITNKIINAAEVWVRVSSWLKMFCCCCLDFVFALVR